MKVRISSAVAFFRLALDSSAVVAVVREEADHEELEQKMVEAEVVAIGAPTLVETAMVVIGIGGERGKAVISWLRERVDLVVVPFDDAHANAAARPSCASARAVTPLP